MCTPDCKLDVHCNGDEYCDFDMGGDGKFTSIIICQAD